LTSASCSATDSSTGTVKVEVDLRDTEYRISENVAWDFLEFSEDWISLARATHAVCFGSLAQRNSAFARDHPRLLHLGASVLLDRHL